MRVDVVIPAYNAARFIGEAIESALSQTHAALRVIVVDDGSSDGTPEVARRFGPRVTVLEQRNSGPAAARNRAIDASDGHVIAFLDADDRWHPEKIARQIAYLREHPECGFVHTAIHHIDADGGIVGRPLNAPLRRRTIGADCFLPLIARCTVTTSSVMIRRRLLGVERFYEALIGPEDWDLWLRLARRTSFGYLDDELTAYRVHETNLVRGRRRMHEAELRVLDRAAALSLDRDVRRAIECKRAEIHSSLGHLAYAEGDAAAARRWFRKAGLGIDRDGVTEYLAVLLPDRLRRPARRWWRLLRGSAA